MNGRPGGQRSGAAAGMQGHHQRQWSSDNFLDSSSKGRWLQSAGLQHLQQSLNTSIPPLQGYNFYGSDGGGQGLRMYRNAQRGFTFSIYPFISLRPSPSQTIYFLYQHMFDRIANHGFDRAVNINKTKYSRSGLNFLGLGFVDTEVTRFTVAMFRAFDILESTCI